MKKRNRCSRKILLSLLLISPLFIYLSVVATIQFSSPREKEPYVHWGGIDPHSEVYISWETLNREESHVKYGISPDNLTYSYNNNTLVSIHHVRLTGLSPQTRYFYQIEDSEENPISEIGTFKTAPNLGNRFNITLISDTQQLWGIGHYDLVARTLSKLEDTDFVAIAGDVVQLAYDQKSWDYFFKVSEKYTKKFPIITVPGNHDGDDIDSLYTIYFTQSHPNGRYYSFNWSNTQFVMAEFADGGDITKGIFENDLHYEWLNQTLQNGQNQVYRVLIFHRQMFSSLDNNEELMKNLIPVIKEYNISLTIYGHKHAYERFFYQNYSYLCLGGGSGLQNAYIRTQEMSETQVMGPILTFLEFSPEKIRLKTVTTTFKIVDEVEFVLRDGFLTPEIIGGG